MLSPETVKNSDIQEKSFDLHSRSDEIDHEAESISDSQQNIEEFSSFDISEDEIATSADEKSFETNSINESEACKSNKENAELNKSGPKQDAIISTANVASSQDQIYPDLGDVNHSFAENRASIQSITKPSSRMSSDTFETPKTIETRASTMTSHPPFDFPKSFENELLFSEASVRKFPQVKKESNILNNKSLSYNSIRRSPNKRLSRQSDYDTSIDDQGEFNASFEPHSIGRIFSKLSLEGEFKPFNNITNTVPTSSELLELQNQLTNCKIQIKLQNDLLRDKLFCSISDSSNKQDLSDELERQILNNINSTKYKIRLNSLQEEFDFLKLENEKLLSKNKDLHCSLELLREEHLEQMTNQFQWQDTVKNIIIKIKKNENFESPKKINNFNDILETLESFVEKLMLNHLDLQQKLEKSEIQLAKYSKEMTELDDKNKTIEKDFENQIKILEKSNSEYIKKNEEYENLLNTEKLKILQLESMNHKQGIEIKKLQEKRTTEYNKELDLQKHMKQLEMTINDLNMELHKLQKLNEGSSGKLQSIIKESSLYHSVILNSLLRIIDKDSASGILSASRRLNHNTNFEEFIKLSSVMQNYEIQSLSTIVDNYELLVKEINQNKNKTSSISELKNHVAILEKKIHDLENLGEKETVRVNELENQNTKLREIVNNSNEDFEKLHKLRLDDLTNKWKTAEEALSQTEKGAKLKILELEEEIHILKTKGLT
jgi:hypothetical protein